MSNRATEVALSNLHRTLATCMTDALQSGDKALSLLHKFKGELPDDVIEYLEKQTVHNPALMSAVSKFLKDNEITCQPEQGSVVSELQERLAAKRKQLKDIPTTEQTLQ